jgi:hypothetical protein
VVDVRDLAEAAAISLTEEGHNGKTYDLVSSEMLRGPDAAATWSKLLRKEIAYAGHADFDGFEAQLREKGNPSWLAYDLRVIFRGFVEREFSNMEDQTARFAALLGYQPRTYSSCAEELAREWAAAGLQPVGHIQKTQIQTMRQGANRLAQCRSPGTSGVQASVDDLRAWRSSTLTLADELGRFLLFELFLVEIGKLEARPTVEQESHHGRYRERSADHI